MNCHKSVFENVVFNQVNLEIVLLRKIVDSDKNLFKKYLANLETIYFFPETLPNYFQNNNKGFSVLLLNIQSFQKHSAELKTFLLD